MLVLVVLDGDVVVLVMVISDVMFSMEIGASLWVGIDLSLVQSGVVDIVVLHSMQRPVLNFMEEFIELVLDLVHQVCAAMELNVMHISVTFVSTMGLRIVSPVLVGNMTVSVMIQLEIASIRVIGSVLVLIVVSVVRASVVFPVIWVVLDAVGIVMFVDMLRVMLALILVAVVVTHVVSPLRLNIVVLTMLLASEVTLILKVGLMIVHVPVSLVEVSIGVVFLTIS